ncbi:MAG TPA: hypothetical protein VJT32_04470 [bacterium]|nr:hypothetical protein [bacterium]
MSLLHEHASLVLMGLTLGGDGLCIVLALFGDLTGRTRLPRIFWWILWVAQVPLGIQGALGIDLFARGARPRTEYHLMYGGLIVLTLIAVYGLRPGGALRWAFVRDDPGYRESRWMLLLCAFLAALVGRTYMTGMLGR